MCQKDSFDVNKLNCFSDNLSHYSEFVEDMSNNNFYNKCINDALESNELSLSERISLANNIEDKRYVRYKETCDVCRELVTHKNEQIRKNIITGGLIWAACITLDYYLKHINSK